MSNFDDFLSCEDKAVFFSSFCIEELGEIFRVAKYCREKYVALVSSIDQYLLSERVTISKKLDESRLIQEILEQEMLQMRHYGLPKFNVSGRHVAAQNVNGMPQGCPCNSVGFPGLPSNSPVLDPRYANIGNKIGDPFKITFGSENHNPQDRNMINIPKPRKPIQVRESGSNVFWKNSGKRNNLAANKNKCLNTTTTSASTKKNIQIVKKRNLSLDYGQKFSNKRGTGSSDQGQTHFGGPRKSRDEFLGGNFNRTFQGENFPEKSGFVQNVMRQNGFGMAN
jgi:hypothetical protein